MKAASGKALDGKSCDLVEVEEPDKLHAVCLTFSESLFKPWRQKLGYNEISVMFNIKTKNEILMS